MGGTIPRALDHYLGAESLQGAPKSPNNFTSAFFNTVNFLLKDLMFEHGRTKLASCPGRRLTSLRPLMILIFYSAAARFFDATMYIYDNSTALEPHTC